MTVVPLSGLSMSASSPIGSCIPNAPVRMDDGPSYCLSTISVSLVTHGSSTLFPCLHRASMALLRSGSSGSGQYATTVPACITRGWRNSHSQMASDCRESSSGEHSRSFFLTLFLSSCFVILYRLLWPCIAVVEQFKGFQHRFIVNIQIFRKSLFVQHVIDDARIDIPFKQRV